MKLWDSEKTYAFLDINPLSYGHAVKKTWSWLLSWHMLNCNSSSSPNTMARSSQTSPTTSCTRS